MEGFIAKKKTCTHLSSTSPSSLAIHRDSHSISKAINKPKIRIIHIFAPEIIKTDVANFRELVQRLTGKPTEKDCKKAPKNPRAQAKREEVGDDNNINIDGDIEHRESKAFPSKPLAKRVDMKGSSTIHEFLGLDSINNVRDNTQRVKEEELYYQEDQEDEEEIGIWNVNGTTTQYDHHENISSSTIGSGGSGFLERFSDLEGFIEELNNGEFPLLPSLLNPNLDANSHYLQYGFGLGGPQLA